MKTTTKISTGACRLVAHRGLSGLETENTCAAFVAAAVSGYWGIETDVHVTADGRFVLCHDDDLKRVAGGAEFDVHAHTLAEAREVPLLDKGAADPAATRSDLRVPEFRDYLAICAKHGKVPVVELKDKLDEATAARIFAEVARFGLGDKAAYISFVWENCLLARRLNPDNEVMGLMGFTEEAPKEAFVANRIGVDFHHPTVDKALVEEFHAAGLRVNAWTVDSMAEAGRLLDCGVDLMTTNILEEA